MWTTLVTVIRKVNRDEEYDRFLSDRKKEGIRIVEIEPEQIYGLLQREPLRQPFLKEESLLLTDVPKVAIEAKKAEIALLGLEWKNGLPMLHVPYVAQGLEDISESYLHMVYQRFHQQPVLIAETEHLYIREIVCEETEDFFALCNEAGLQIKGMQDEDFIKAYQKYQYGLYGYGFWSLIEKESGAWVGIAGVEDREREGEAYLELGYAIIPEKRRRGYAREACLAILEYMREEQAAEGKIKCFVPKENIASQHTAQSIGFLQTEDIFDVFYCYERVL